MRSWQLLVPALAWLFAPAMPAAAQTYTVTGISPMSIGTVAAATSGVTVFRNGTDGTVTRVSGNGNLVAGPYTYTTVTLRCVDQGVSRCNNASNRARVYIGRTGVNTGRATTITTITAAAGTATIVSGTNPSDSTLDLVIGGWTASNQDLTLQVGALLPINGDDGTGTTGSASSQFYVFAAKNPTVPTVGLTGTISATVRRALQIAKVADLRFGTFIRPSSGTNSVVVDANGTRTQTDAGGTTGAGTIVLMPSTFGAAQFTATGQIGATFSLSYPATFAMSGPGSALTVTLMPSPASGTQTIPATGTLSLYSGGQFSVTSSQATGGYSGSYTVTISYN